ncbi:PREDICTED: uncharacterized protein LOC105365182 [Ceratosolen solmsi marchali]|uniref:Uncharacterized protein LOC105365182 n=1 Tax=Ceratosolen solmsi marchali TaxID=326594 RepID=A0AAJ7DYZ7_9HYME|nr:PREDICTED: uncharacterized protein LOC105365182 [Ceratosolen solmsi marchali]
MTHKCCVRDCEEIVKESRIKGLPLHKFPKDVLLRNKWLSSGGFELDFKPTTSQIVCYKHFKQADYEIGRSHKLFLKKGSIPTIFDDYENHPDPVGPSSAFITSRLQAKELKLSQSLALSEFDNSNNYFETSCSSLEASMDSSNSVHCSFSKKDCDQIKTKEVNFETSDTINTSRKAILNSPLQISPFLNSEGKSASDIDSETHEQISTIAIEDSKKTKVNDSMSKMLSRAGLNFLPGSKLEAKDFNEKWYSARVVETDWIEREVLIHFDKWSSRYDEWIPMDSSRLRMLQVQSRETKLKEFMIGERILATWVDGKKYPAKVNGSLGNDKYDVLFDDGYSKILKSSKMTKLLEISGNKLKEENNYVGSKQERRDKKRKHTITELFHSHSKKKIKTENEKLSKKKVKKDIFKCSNNSEQIVSKWFDKNSDENASGDLEEDYATFIGNLRVEIEDSTYKCPKNGCNKNFRKENLLQMHIKHYHPEYSKFLGSTPNVADLAYARTIGESVEDIIPKKSRIVNTQSTQTLHGTVQSISPIIDTESEQTEIDDKLENKDISDNNTIAIEDNLSKQNNSCTMSPGTLFDMRFKEEKVHTGIKTLPPVRQPLVVEVEENLQIPDCNNENDTQKLINISDKGKIYKKRQQQYYYDSADKIKKPKIISENDENYDHCDDSLLDGEDILDLNYKCITNNNKSKAGNNDNISIKNSGIMMVNGEFIKVEKLRREEIINCTCGITEEDGLMIQCDLCLCWQHGHCNAIEKEKDVPEKYICYICQHAHRQRASKKYFHDQDWIREGKLPSIYHYSSNNLKLNERAAMLKRSYDLIAGLLQIQTLLHSLRVKVNVAQNKDHPKLYLWAKNWCKIIIPSLKTEPVPILEIIKTEDLTDNYTENNTKEKLEISFSGNDCEKLITSDTELMKILEEDSTQAEESKPSTKYSVSNDLKDEGRILLDALTKNGFEEQDEQVSLIKHESNIHNLLMKENSIAQCANSEKLNKLQNVSTDVRIKPLSTLQPIIPEPEAPIDPIECKLRLLEHIDYFQNYIDSTLTFMEVQLSALESMNITEKQNNNQHIQTKQTIQMLLHDLESIQKLAALC